MTLPGSLKTFAWLMLLCRLQAVQLVHTRMGSQMMLQQKRKRKGKAKMRRLMMELTRQ